MDDYSTKNARDVTFSQLYVSALAGIDGLHVSVLADIDGNGIPLTLTDAAAKRLWAVSAK